MSPKPRSVGRPHGSTSSRTDMPTAGSMIGAALNRVDMHSALWANTGASPLTGRGVLGERGSLAERRERAKEEPQKLQLAAPLRAGTTATLAWVATRLTMGTPGALNHRLYLWRKGLLR